MKKIDIFSIAKGGILLVISAVLFSSCTKEPAKPGDGGGDKKPTPSVIVGAGTFNTTSIQLTPTTGAQKTITASDPGFSDVLAKLYVDGITFNADGTATEAKFASGITYTADGIGVNVLTLFFSGAAVTSEYGGIGQDINGKWLITVITDDKALAKIGGITYNGVLYDDMVVQTLYP